MSVVSVCDLVLLPLVQKSRATHVLPVEAFVDRIKNGIKWSTFLLGADQGLKMNSEWPISTDKYIFSDNREACPLNRCKVKLFRMEWSSDKETFSPIKILDPRRKCFYRQYLLGGLNKMCYYSHVMASSTVVQKLITFWGWRVMCNAWMDALRFLPPSCLISWN